MADIRINALATTATTPASDDYLALDGTAQGTRKILATNIANNVTDVILGASGPSVKSTLSARAPRQGLVFDGTAGATVSVAGPGTSDFTQAAWVRTTGGTQPITSGTPTAIASLYVSSTGKAQFRNDGVAILLTGNATINDGKSHLVVATRTGGTLTIYVDGISDASVADSTNFSTAITRIGLDYSGSVRFTGSLVGPLIYNRALSASEVVALYEAGAPAGADYNSASNTSTVTGDSSTFTSGVGSWLAWGAGTITASAGVGNVTSGATTDNGDYLAAQLPQSPAAFTNLNKRYRITLTLGSVTGGTVIVRNLVGSGTRYATGLTSGTHIIDTGLITGQQNFGLAASAAGVTFTVDNITVVPLGLLLAPDAAQAGGGLVWYDTSGNAANITLPASGVSWNVPSSAKTATGWSFNSPLLVGTTIDAGYTITARASDASIAAMSADASAQVRLNAQSGIAILETVTNTPLRIRTNSTEAMRLFANGNVFIGASPVDGGQKLQVSGTGYFSGNVGIGASPLTPLHVKGNVVSNRGVLMVQDSSGSGSSSYPVISLYDSADSERGSVGMYGADFKVINKISGNLILATNNTTALTLDSSQNATFAGAVSISKANPELAIRSASDAAGQIQYLTFGSPTYNRSQFRVTSAGTNDGSIALYTFNAGSAVLSQTWAKDGNATFAGSIAINNTVQTAAAVASTHKVTISIGGSTYYLLATNV